MVCELVTGRSIRLWKSDDGPQGLRLIDMIDNKEKT